MVGILWEQYYLTISIFSGWPGPLTCQLSQQHFWQRLDIGQFRGRSSGECLEYRYSDIEGRSVCLGFRFEGILIVLWLWKGWHILSSLILWICIQPYTDVFPNRKYTDVFPNGENLLNNFEIMYWMCVCVYVYDLYKYIQNFLILLQCLCPKKVYYICKYFVNISHIWIFWGPSVAEFLLFYLDVWHTNNAKVRKFKKLC